MAWTTPRTWVTNELVTAALMNEQIKDNENYLKARMPITHEVKATGTVSTTSTNYINLTNASITFTPVVTGKAQCIFTTTVRNDVTGGPIAYFELIDNNTNGTIGIETSIKYLQANAPSIAITICGETPIIAGTPITIVAKWKTSLGTIQCGNRAIYTTELWTE